MNYSKATRQELQKHCRGLEKELVKLRKEVQTTKCKELTNDQLVSDRFELTTTCQDLKDKNFELESRIEQLIKSRDFNFDQLKLANDRNKAKSDEYAKLSESYSKLETRKHRAVGKLVVSITVNVMLAVGLLYCLL